MPDDSPQVKNTRTREARVNMQTPVFTNGASTLKDVPMVIGVIGDLTGSGTPSPKDLETREKAWPEDLAKRRFVNISAGGLDKVVASMRPTVDIEVSNRLNPQGAPLSAKLTFQSMKDFEPDRLVQMVPELNELHVMRQRLLELRSKLQSDKAFKARVQSALKGSGLQQLKSELNLSAD